MHPVVRYRSASACCVLGLSLVLFARDVHADDQPAPGPSAIAATMQCDRATEPGRVKCSVEAHTTGAGRSIAWADVALLELPDFTAALKGRIGPADATSRDKTSQKWAFGLVARKTGDGEAKARVRALVCEAAAGDAGAPKCSPATVDVRATVHVGS